MILRSFRLSDYMPVTQLLEASLAEDWGSLVLLLEQ